MAHADPDVSSAHPERLLGPSWAEAAPPPRPLARVGVVLAAGRSERLHQVTGGGSKSLVRLGGLTLVERAVRGLLAYGLEKVIVVVGYHAGPVGAVVSRLATGRVHAVLAEHWELGNGASLAAAEDALAGEELFALVTADHVFSEGALRDLLQSRHPAVLVDAAPSPEVWAEGTRVRVAEGRAVAFGKHLEEPAVDCGAFVLPAEVFDAQREAAAEGDSSLAGAVSRLAARMPVRAVPLPPRAWWKDVDTPEDLRAVRVSLRRSLVKDGDGPVSRWVNRPLSTRLSVALAPLRPSPDLMSLVAFLLGLAGAWLLAVGEGVAGALLVHATSILDGVDGEVARLQVRGSPRGAMLDGVLDRVSDCAILAALGLWALDAGAAPDVVLVLAVAATAGAVLSMASKDRAAALGLSGAPERVIGWLLAGRDGRLALATAGGLLGMPVAVLVAVTVTALLGLALRTYFLRAASRHAMV